MIASTAWMFQSCPDTVEFRDKPGSDDPNLVQKRIMRSFTAVKIFTNVDWTVAPTAAGSLETNTPAASYGSGTLTGAAIETGLKWLCVSNNTEMIQPVGTNAIKVTQTWVTYTPWEDFDLSSVGGP